MAAKREQTIWPNLWDVCERMENTYPLKAMCSAGILVLVKMEATERERAMSAAKLYPDSPADVVGEGGGDVAKGPTQMVPLLTLRIERKKKQLFQQLLKTVADSPDLPQSLKMKIEQDLKEAKHKLSEQTQKIRRDMREEGD